MTFHPDVLAVHAQFGGDLESMQALYDRPDHLATIARLSAELARARAERDRAALVAADEANRADAAEAALAERTKERDEARAERDELDFLYHEGGTMEVQLSKAEAERDRLREAATDFLNAMRFGKMGTKALAAYHALAAALQKEPQP